MRIIIPLVVLVLCAGSIGIVFGGAPDELKTMSRAELNALLTHMEQQLANVNTLSLEFEQEKHLSLLTDVIKSRGVCLFVRPDTVRFEITDPFASVLIASGQSVAKFEQLGGQWQRLDIGSPDAILMVTGQIASWLTGHFRDESSIYDVTAVSGKQTTIVLTPHPAGMRQYITSVRLDLAEDRIRVVAVTIYEPGGDFTRIRFFNEQRNIELPRSLFDTNGRSPAKFEILGAPATTQSTMIKR